MRFDSNIYYHEVEQYRRGASANNTPADKLMEEWKETALLSTTRPTSQASGWESTISGIADGRWLRQIIRCRCAPISQG